MLKNSTSAHLKSYNSQQLVDLCVCVCVCVCVWKGEGGEGCVLCLHSIIIKNYIALCNDYSKILFVFWLNPNLIRLLRWTYCRNFFNLVSNQQGENARFFTGAAKKWCVSSDALHQTFYGHTKKPKNEVRNVFV